MQGLQHFPLITCASFATVCNGDTWKFVQKIPVVTHVCEFSQ